MKSGWLSLGFVAALAFSAPAHAVPIQIGPGGFGDINPFVDGSGWFLGESAKVGDAGFIEYQFQVAGPIYLAIASGIENPGSPNLVFDAVSLTGGSSTLAVIATSCATLFTPCIDNVSAQSEFAVAYNLTDALTNYVLRIDRHVVGPTGAQKVWGGSISFTETLGAETPVPLPPALALFGGVIIASGAFSRWRAKKSA